MGNTTTIGNNTYSLKAKDTTVGLINPEDFNLDNAKRGVQEINDVIEKWNNYIQQIDAVKKFALDMAKRPTSKINLGEFLMSEDPSFSPSTLYHYFEKHMLVDSFMYYKVIYDFTGGQSATEVRVKDGPRFIQVTYKNYIAKEVFNLPSSAKIEWHAFKDAALDEYDRAQKILAGTLETIRSIVSTSFAGSVETEANGGDILYDCIIQVSQIGKKYVDNKKYPNLYIDDAYERKPFGAAVQKAVNHLKVLRDNQCRRLII